MQIPKQFNIRNKRYTVTVVPGKLASETCSRYRYVYGNVDYIAREIHIAGKKPQTGDRVAKRYQAHTFWHEVTHAILKDMGHRLEGSEDFVDNFARRLNDVVHTAKL